MIPFLDGSTDAILRLVVRAGVAVGALALAWHGLREGREQIRTAVAAVRASTWSGDDGSSVVSLSGTAHSAGDHLNAPLTGTSCLAYAARVSQDDNSVLFREHDAVPFEVTGPAAGPVTVHPIERGPDGEPSDRWQNYYHAPGVTLPNGLDEYVRPVVGDEFPAGVADVVERTDGVADQETDVTEDYLEPGTDVFAVGLLEDGRLVNREGEPFGVVPGTRRDAIGQMLEDAAHTAVTVGFFLFLALVLATPAGTIVPPIPV